MLYVAIERRNRPTLPQVRVPNAGRSPNPLPLCVLAVVHGFRALLLPLPCERDRGWRPSVAHPMSTGIIVQRVPEPGPILAWHFNFKLSQVSAWIHSGLKKGHTWHMCDLDWARSHKDLRNALKEGGATEPTGHGHGDLGDLWSAQSLGLRAPHTSAKAALHPVQCSK